MTDPAVWGPLLVAGLVLYVGYRIEAEIKESALQRDRQHRAMIKVLDGLPDELDQIKTHLWSIVQAVESKDR